MASGSLEYEHINYTDEELQELFYKYRDGDLEAKEQLILHFFPLVEYLAKKYCFDCCVPYDDLYQEGCYGLILAIDKYDVTRNTKFSGFAKTYIEKYIKKALREQNQSQPLTYQEDFYYLLQKYLRIVNELTTILHRTPNDKEIAEKMEISEKKVRLLKSRTFHFISQETMIDEGFAESAENQVIKQLGDIDLSFLNIRLTKRELDILRRRLGFTEDGYPQTLYEISAETGISYELARRAYQSAIRKIHNKAVEQKHTPSSFNV